MDLTDKLSDNLPGGDRQDEQAVIICLQFPVGKLQEHKIVAALTDLAELIASIVETSHRGTYLGHQFSSHPEEDRMTIYLCGADARLLYNEVKPILQSLPLVTGFSVLRRYSLISPNDSGFSLPS